MSTSFDEFGLQDGWRRQLNEHTDAVAESLSIARREKVDDNDKAIATVHGGACTRLDCREGSTCSQCNNVRHWR